MESNNSNQTSPSEQTHVFPTRFEIMAVSELIEDNCAHIINAYNECNSNPENQSNNACLGISKELYICTEKQIDLAQNRCPIEYSDLLTCLQDNDNQPETCLSFFDSFTKCMKNL